MKNKIRLLPLIVIALFITVGVAQGQTIKDRFSGILVDHDVDINGDLDVDGTANLDVIDIDGAVDMATTATVGTGLTVTSGGATITAGGLTITDGDAVIADDLRITAQTAVTATDATTITLTGGFQQLTAASEVTPTFAAGTEGDIAIIVAHSTGPINIADSGTVKIASAAALGQYDSITLIYDGTAAAWIELARSNN